MSSSLIFILNGMYLHLHLKICFYHQLKPKIYMIFHYIIQIYKCISIHTCTHAYIYYRCLIWFNSTLILGRLQWYSDPRQSAQVLSSKAECTDTLIKGRVHKYSCSRLSQRYSGLYQSTQKLLSNVVCTDILFVGSVHTFSDSRWNSQILWS